MRHKTLVDTDRLSTILSETQVLVVDCRFDLADTEAGARAYVERHIPGAVYAHLDRDLSGPKTGRNGRHPLPDPIRAADTFGRLGVDASTQVVAYDEDSGMFASRLWWMLRWLGHDLAAVLDGGFRKWRDEGRPTRSGEESRKSRVFVPRPQQDMVASLPDVQAMLGRPDWRLLDARAPERYRGEIEPLDPVPGHIPGATNHHFKGNLGDDGQFKSPDALRAKLLEAIGDVPVEHTVCYCGSGVTACHDLLALEHAGLSGARLYPGSWSEWAADPARPVETGAGRDG